MGGQIMDARQFSQQLTFAFFSLRSGAAFGAAGWVVSYTRNVQQAALPVVEPAFFERPHLVQGHLSFHRRQSFSAAWTSACRTRVGDKVRPTFTIRIWPVTLLQELIICCRASDTDPVCWSSCVCLTLYRQQAGCLGALQFSPFPTLHLLHFAAQLHGSVPCISWVQR